jgi:hypothetical protein
VPEQDFGRNRHGDLYERAALAEDRFERKALVGFVQFVWREQSVGQWREAEIQNRLELRVAAGSAAKAHVNSSGQCRGASGAGKFDR